MEEIGDDFVKSALFLRYRVTFRHFGLCFIFNRKSEL